MNNKVTIIVAVLSVACGVCNAQDASLHQKAEAWFFANYTNALPPRSNSLNWAHRKRRFCLMHFPPLPIRWRLPVSHAPANRVPKSIWHPACRLIPMNRSNSNILTGLPVALACLANCGPILTHRPKAHGANSPPDSRPADITHKGPDDPARA